MKPDEGGRVVELQERSKPYNTLDAQYAAAYNLGPAKPKQREPIPSDSSEPDIERFSDFDDEFVQGGSEEEGDHQDHTEDDDEEVVAFSSDSTAAAPVVSTTTNGNGGEHQLEK